MVNKLKNAFVSDIVPELTRLGDKNEEAFLTKRVSVTASNLKRDKELGAKKVGKKSRYFIK